MSGWRESRTARCLLPALPVPALHCRYSSPACTPALALEPNATPSPNPTPTPNQGRRRSAERVEEEGAFEGGLLHGQGRRGDALGGVWRGVFVRGVLQVRKYDLSVRVVRDILYLLTRYSLTCVLTYSLTHLLTAGRGGGGARP